MFGLFICVLIIPNLMSKVMSEILCKDSRIDSITYANDIQMYFFTSGGYYWWIKESGFPPKDTDAKPLPKPFIMGQAAVYVDTENGCANSRSTGIKPSEKDVWIEEYVGTEHKIMAFDTKLGKWREAIKYSSDRCISRARIEWANGKPLDAMFARNYLEIFFVQGMKYAMVDCNHICNDPEGYGNDKQQYNITDFHTVDPIYGMFLRKNKVLFMFHEKTYFELEIQPNSLNGKLETTKGKTEMSLLKDFMKIDSPGECLQTTTTQTPPVDEKPTEPKEEDVPQEPAKPDDGPSSEDSGNTLFIILGVLVVVVVIIIICVLVFFAMKRKSKPDEEGVNEKAAKEKGTEKSMSKSGGPSAAPPAAPSAVATNPKTGSSVKNASTITQKSNIGAVGVASKAGPNSAVKK